MELNLKYIADNYNKENHYYEDILYWQYFDKKLKLLRYLIFECETDKEQIADNIASKCRDRALKGQYYIEINDIVVLFNTKDLIRKKAWFLNEDDFAVLIFKALKKSSVAKMLRDNYGIKFRHMLTNHGYGLTLIPILVW